MLHHDFVDLAKQYLYENIILQILLTYSPPITYSATLKIYNPFPPFTSHSSISQSSSILRKLQLPGRQVPAAPEHRVPPGPVLHPHHPHRHRVLGQLLDGRGARAGESGAGGDHAPHHLQQVRRSQLWDSTSQLCQGETEELLCWR